MLEVHRNHRQIIESLQLTQYPRNLAHLPRPAWHFIIKVRMYSAILGFVVMISLMGVAFDLLRVTRVNKHRRVAALHDRETREQDIRLACPGLNYCLWVAPSSL